MIISPFTPSIAPVSYSDEFTRGNSTTSVGTDWTNRRNTCGINTNSAYPVTVGEICVATYDYFMGSNDMEVTVTVGTLNGTPGTDTVRAVLGADSAGQHAQLVCSGTFMYIYTYETWAGSPTTRDTLTGQSFTSGDTLTLRRVGNVYTAKQNGSLITDLTWTDSGDDLPRDGSHLIVGLAGYNSGGDYRRIAAWSAIDI